MIRNVVLRNKAGPSTSKEIDHLCFTGWAGGEGARAGSAWSGLKQECAGDTFRGAPDRTRNVEQALQGHRMSLAAGGQQMWVRVKV